MVLMLCMLLFGMIASAPGRCFKATPGISLVYIALQVLYAVVAMHPFWNKPGRLWGWISPLHPGSAASCRKAFIPPVKAAIPSDKAIISPVKAAISADKALISPVKAAISADKTLIPPVKGLIPSVEAANRMIGTFQYIL